MKLEFLETIKAFNGKIENLSYHQKRYESVLAAYGYSNYKMLGDYLEAPKKGLYRCRLCYTVDEITEVFYYPYHKRTIQRLKSMDADNLVYDKKYVNREAINALFAKRGECDDILLMQNGLITDTSIANVAFFDGSRWLTPKKPLLAGTTRQRLLDDGFLIEADIALAEVKKFQKMALMNAMIDFDIIADKNIEEVIC